MVAGLASAGVDVLLLGVLPTPGVAYLTGALGADLGVMLSASHNPMPDNGIKFLARGGAQARRRHRGSRSSARLGEAVGRARPAATSAGSDVRRRPSTSTSPTSSAPSPARSTGSRSCSTAPTAPPSEVGAAGAARRRRRGDRDPRRARRPQHQRRLRLHPPRRPAAGRARARRRRRASPSTATPTAAWPSTPTATSSTATRSWRSSRWRCARPATCANDTVVATVMSNLGFVQAMRGAGVGVRQTKVGDRYVLEAMKAGGYTLGGEQSGHVIMSRPRHHRRRHPDRAARARADGRHRRSRWPSWPR